MICCILAIGSRFKVLHTDWGDSALDSLHSLDSHDLHLSDENFGHYMDLNGCVIFWIF